MGLGKPLKLMAKPPQERLPIYIGAIGPKSVELTGEIADGWIPAFFDPEDGAGLLDSLRGRASRRPAATAARSTSRRRCRSPSTTTSTRRATRCGR